MTGQELRKQVTNNGLLVWRVAQACGVSLEYLTRTWRLKEVPTEKAERILRGIEIAKKEG